MSFEILVYRCTKVYSILRKGGETFSAESVAFCRLKVRQLVQLIGVFTPGFASSKLSHSGIALGLYKKITNYIKSLAAPIFCSPLLFPDSNHFRN
jgi:hypothetical protein